MRKSVALIHAGLNKIWVHNIVRLFQDDPGVRDCFPNDVPPQYLVGTTKVLGVGLTLTKTRRTVQMEPKWLMRDEVQARGRVNCITQIGRTYSYSLICTDSEPEVVISKRQGARKYLLNKALESVDFGKRNVTRGIGDDEDRDSKDGRTDHERGNEVWI